ncbi:MAG: transposase [Candidatus Kryptoniota bacterium]
MIELDSLIPPPPERVTPEITTKVEAMLHSISIPSHGAERGVGGKCAMEAHIAHEYGIPTGTQRHYKTELRKLFGLSRGASFDTILNHPKLRIAIEHIVARDKRSDKNTLRAGRRLCVVAPNGEVMPIESFVKSLYIREGVNASACYSTLKSRCALKLVIHEDGTPATLDDLPAEPSVVRFLRKFLHDNIYVRRARSRRHDWEVSEEPFITRNPDEYRPGQLWFGDHTELDFLVVNERGKIDRRWITAFIDMRTRVIVGYNMSWQPNSTTIALAFRNAVTGEQLRAYNGNEYQRLNIQCVPEEVEIDNGKDYRSHYTQRVFGKIDFDDKARLSVQRITKLHYALPYHGQSKAEMERWFGTIQVMLKYLPGYKGSNARKNQPDTLKQEVRQGEIMNVETFDKMVALAINVYNNRIHRGLKNQSPLQCYLTNSTQNRTIDERVLDFLMMKVNNKIIRRSQVILLGNEYYSDSLMEFNGRKTEVYYDPQDLGFVSVYLNGEFKAVAINKEMIGKDERGWLKILHDRRQAEKGMQEKIKSARSGISRIDAKLLLLEGQFYKAVPVSAELLRTGVQNLTLLTGVESQAFEQQKELDEQKAITEFEKSAKKHPARLTLTDIGRIK